MNIRSYFDETIVAVAFSKLLEKVIDILLNWNLEETIQQFEQISATYSKTNYLSSITLSVYYTWPVGREIMK